MKNILSLFILCSIFTSSLSSEVSSSAGNTVGQVVKSATDSSSAKVAASVYSCIVNCTKGLSKNIGVTELAVGSFAALGVYHFCFYIYPEMQKYGERFFNIHYDRDNEVDTIDLELSVRNALYNWRESEHPTAADINIRSEEVIYQMNSDLLKGSPIKGGFTHYDLNNNSLTKHVEYLKSILPVHKKRIGLRTEKHSMEKLIKDIALELGLDARDLTSLSMPDFKKLEDYLINKPDNKRGYKWHWNELEKKIIKTYLKAKMKEARIKALHDLAKGVARDPRIRVIEAAPAQRR